MPCSDGREPWLQGTYHSQREAELAERNDELARLLCFQCKALVKYKREDLMTVGVKRWWEEHKKVDAERKADIKTKIAALEAEKKALEEELKE